MLTFEQKRFAYDKYTFNSNIQTILDFMTPVSRLDERIEEVKKQRLKFIGYAAIYYTLAGIISIYYFKFHSLLEYYGWDTFYRGLIFVASLVPFVLIAYLNGPARDVDNDLNNFIMPFLKKIQKYVSPFTNVTLITDLGSKLSKNKKLNTETYADAYENRWFSMELPLADNLKVLIDLTDNIGFYGKTTTSKVANHTVFSNLQTNIILRFVFPKDNYKQFYSLKDCELTWETDGDKTVLTVKSSLRRFVEFYFPSTKIVGLTFDNNYCLNLIDSVYAKLRGINDSEFTPENLRKIAEELFEKARRLEKEAAGLLEKANAIEESLVKETSIIEDAETEVEAETDNEPIVESEPQPKA